MTEQMTYRGSLEMAAAGAVAPSPVERRIPADTVSDTLVAPPAPASMALGADDGHPHPVVADAVDGSAMSLQYATPLDNRANLVIGLASGRAGGPTARSTEAGRLQTVLHQIVDYYYPGGDAKVAQYLWEESNPGLSTTYRGSGASLQGVITGGRYFLTQTNATHFARRVLQVGHELQHIDQQRAGMGGGLNRHKREFLAFHWEATTPELPGTGSMQHSTRVRLIDAAIQNYLAMSAADQATYAAQHAALLTLRAAEEAILGVSTPVPTTPAP